MMSNGYSPSAEKTADLVGFNKESKDGSSPGFIVQYVYCPPGVTSGEARVQ